MDENEIYNYETEAEVLLPIVLSYLEADEEQLNAILDEEALEYKNLIESHFESFIDYAGEMILDMEFDFNEDFKIPEERITEYQNTISLIIQRQIVAYWDAMLLATSAVDELEYDVPYSYLSLNDNAIFIELRDKVIEALGFGGQN